MRKPVLAVFVLVVGLGLGGCPKTKYSQAVTAEHQFKTVVAAFQKAEIIESQNGRIDPAEHRMLEAGVEKVGLTGQALVTALQNGASNTTIQQNFDTLARAVGDLLNSGVLGIKNETSKQVLQLSIVTAQDILNNVAQLLSLQVVVPATKGAN